MSGTMRGLILITLLHLSLATIDVKKLTEEAGTKLHTLTDTAATTLQTIGDQATIKLQTLSDQTSAAIKSLVENIDLYKLKQLDFLNVIPRIQDRLHHAPNHLEKAKALLGKIQSLTGKDLVMAFDGDVPWPLRRNDDIYKVYEI